MPTTITNQARLQFSYGTTTATAASNIATAVMQDPLSVQKSTLEADYRANGDLTYMITLVNGGPAALTPVTVTDDLGTYDVSPTLSVTPLNYTGPAHLFINGVFSAALTPVTAADSVAFTIPSLASGETALLLYKVRVNAYAPLPTGATIQNTVTATAPTLLDPVEATHTANAAAYADVSILKTMSPNPVTGGGTLTYTFDLYNYGNTLATDVVFSDAFSPAPAAITVAVDGAVIPPADYDYAGGVLTLPAPGSAYALAIPAAAFAQDGATGEYAVNPGVRTIVVTGVL